MGKLSAVLEEGRRRSDLMAETMDDQLTECGYQAIKRDQIDWAMKIGTGVTKGPVTGDRMRRGWKQKPVQGPDGKPVVDRSPAAQGRRPALSRHGRGRPARLSPRRPVGLLP
jgi:hypothetical protein